MPQSLKDLIVVLVLSTVVFALIKPTALRFTEPADFARRRSAFYVLTCAGFLCPSFWVYAIIAVPTLLVVGLMDSNPSAVYLFLLYVIPPTTVSTPIFGMRSLMDFNNQVLLSFLVIIPALLRRRRSQAIPGITLVDGCFLAHGIVASALYLHVLQLDGVPYPFTTTDFMRRVVVFMIVGFAPYFLISRSSVSRRAVMDSASALLIPCIIMAVIAVFEAAKHWLLYEPIPQTWGVAAAFASYLTRAGSLRAMASAGHPLALGYMLAVALGLWLALSRYVPSRAVRVAIPCVLVLGLLAAYSRGPWACALIIYLVFALQKPRALSGIVRTLPAALAGVAILAVSPLGTKIAAVIPFLGGSVDVGNIDYRQLLWDRVWMLFKQSPILGDQFALTKMQDLRQGQGIVDFVNGYAMEMVSDGSIGLILFFGFALLVLWHIHCARRQMAPTDKPFALVGAGLTSCIVGTLFLWAFGGPNNEVFWALLALGLGYAHIVPAAQRVSRAPAVAQPPQKPATALLRRYRVRGGL